MTTIDLMEYATDALSQAAYVTNSVEAIISQDTTNNNSGVLGDISNVEYAEGQKIILSSDVIITAVKLTFNLRIGSPTGNVTCKIETLSAGLPSGTLAHASATVAIVPTPSAENTFTFASSFTLTAGTYWITWTVGAQSTNAYWYVGQNYVGGSSQAHGYSVNGAWNTQFDRNSTYKLYGKSLQSFSESTIKSQGSYSLKGSAAITDSANKTLTKTVSPTLDLSNRNVLKFDIYSSRTGSNIKIGIHDSGGTVTEITPNIISANTWQRVNWYLSSVVNANKDVIDQIIITILNADAANVFYIDNFYIAPRQKIIVG